MNINIKLKKKTKEKNKKYSSFEKHRFHPTIGNTRSQDDLFNAILNNDLVKVKEIISSDSSLLFCKDNSYFLSEDGTATQRKEIVTITELCEVEKILKDGKSQKQLECIKRIIHRTPLQLALNLKREEIVKFLETKINKKC